MNLDFNSNFEQCKKFFINPYMQDKAKPFGGLAELKKKDRKEKIKASLAMAYSTAQRTFGGISKIEKNKGDIFINLAAKIDKEFCSAKAWESFRDKLNSWRNELITQFQQSYTMTVGQAQKIINMTFKFLYCLEDKPNEDDYKYCHMPLDSYTIQTVVGENTDAQGIRAANVLNRAQRLEKLLELGAPDFVVANERLYLIEELALNAFAVKRGVIERDDFLQAFGVC